MPADALAPVAAGASELAGLLALLDEALDLPDAALEPWLARRPQAQQHLLPRLRRMLAERRDPGAQAYLSAGPRWDDDGGGETARPGEQVGAYRLIREIGRGGMASVWLASRHDGAVKREVALKMPLQRLESTAQIERFERERDVLALLAHAQIARLYDAGVTAAGRPFIVLEHVQGEPITEACDRQGLDLPSRLQLFLQVLAAVGHAHRHLVVHRDIKPSNVFVDGQGQVKLLDFGIAKLLSGSAAAGTAAAAPLTRDNGCALTPRYAAPEQIAGQAVSTATDVYSLGVLLYELLVGAAPHGAVPASMAEVVHAALHAEPVRPSQAVPDAAALARRGISQIAHWRSQLAGDLDTIVLKAMRKTPGERYSSVEHYAEDLRSFLAHRPISARPPTLFHRARLFLRRHRAASVAAALGMAAATALAGTAWVQHRQGEQARERAEAVRDFMFDLVDDAEADEGSAKAEPTGRQMIDGAIRRARAGFADQPRLRGELLADLGRMRGRLGDAEVAEATERESLALLEAHAPAGDAALNKTRAHLADALLGRGDSAAAERLAGRALADCVTGRECAKARLYAHTVLSNIALRRGRPDLALAQVRQGAQDSAVGFGAHDSETALAWLSVAIVSRQAGQDPAARLALQQAQDIARGATLRRADRIALQRTQAVLDFDAGEYTRARDVLLQLLAGPTLAGTERAVPLRLLANTLLALGQPDAARQAAAQALALPGIAGVEAVLVHQAHARALSLAGETFAAAQEMQAVVDGWRSAGYADTSMEVLRARRMAIETGVRGGDFAAALAPLQALAVQQAAAPGGQVLELAATLDLIGCVQRELGQPAAARDAHARAGLLLAARLPSAHPLRLRNALYQLAASGDAAVQVRQRAASAFVDPLPDDSAWRRVVAAWLAPRGCRGAPAPGCALVL